MKRLIFILALLPALALGTLFLNIPDSAAAPVQHAALVQTSTAAHAGVHASPPGSLAGVGAVTLLGALMLAAFLRDGASNISPIQCLKPASRSTTGTGDAIDLQGFNGATLLFEIGDWAAGTYTCTVQESDTTTDGDFTDVADADLIGTEPVVDGAADDDQVYKVGYKGSKRYIRGKIIGSGSPLTAVVSSITAIRHRPDQNTGV